MLGSRLFEVIGATLNSTTCPTPQDITALRPRSEFRSPADARPVRTLVIMIRPVARVWTCMMMPSAEAPKFFGPVLTADHLSCAACAVSDHTSILSLAHSPWAYSWPKDQCLTSPVA